MRKKIALFHHNLLVHRGGGDLVCAWVLEALKDDFDLTFITWGKKISLAEVDLFYGTSLAKSQIKIEYIPVLTYLGLENRPYRLLVALIERYLKKRRNDFDVLFSTYNELDFGKKGIQFIHGPSRSDVGAQFYLLDYKKSYLRGLYHGFCNWLSDFDIDRVRANTTLVNSEWGAKVYKETYGDYPATVAYVPIVFRGQPLPWEQRRNDFLCIGDLLPVKKTHESFKVVQKVRALGHDIGLRVIGDTPGAYARFVKQEAKKYPFVTMEGRCPREKVSELISQSRYGIHMRDYEGFGIGIGEMAFAGCLVFVPGKGGGQLEALNFNSNLLYNGIDDAVNKIDAMLKNPDLQKCVQKEIMEHAVQFSAENFKQRIQEIVRNFN